METANLNGFNQIGDPASTRSSTTRPTTATSATGTIAAATTSIGRFHPDTFAINADRALTAVPL